MPKDPPSQSYGVASTRFWRNVTLIALAHVALLLGLIRWSVEARSSSNAQSIVWISGAEDLAAGEPKSSESPQLAMTPIPPPESERLEKDEATEETPLVTAAKSEIELPSPTPTPTSTPRPTATPTPKQKETPEPTPKPTPKKTLVAKASPKPSPKAKSSPDEIGGRGKENRRKRGEKEDREDRSSENGVFFSGVGQNRFSRQSWPRRRREQPHRNSGGMAICCTTVFIAHGSSRPPTSLLAPKFRRWSKFESRKMGACPVSKSSSRPRMLW